MRKIPHLSRLAPGVHPASCMVCTRSFQELKLPDHGIDNPPHCSADPKERAELCLYSPLCAVMAGHRVNFTFTFSAFKIRCVHLNTCSVYSLIPVCTLFIISLPFVHNRSKLEGTVHTVTVIKIYVLSHQMFYTRRLQLQTAQLRSLVQVYVNITDFIRNITHTYELLIS